MRKSRIFHLIVTASVCITFMFLIGDDLMALVFLQKDKPGLLNLSKEVEMTEYDPWLEEQKKRKEDLHTACRKVFGETMEPNPLTSRYKRGTFYIHLIVDDRHQVLFCYIPKIACTSWKKVMMVQSGKTSVDDPNDVNIEDPHDPGAITTLNTATPEAADHRLKTYKKLLFVRHPFERLLSAYRSKFEASTETSHKFQRIYAYAIMPNFKIGDIIPFSTFVDFILKTDKKGESLGFSDHWAKFKELCYPCHVQYDFIGRFETLLNDAKHILREIGAPLNMTFPFQYPEKTLSLVPEYMKLLSEEQIQGLYKVYRDDFILFDYTQNFTLI